MNEINNVVDEVSEEIVEQIDDHGEENLETSADVEPLRKRKKHEEAKELIVKAKDIVAKADAQTQECKLLLADDLKEYEVAKIALNEGGLEACTVLLEKVSEFSEYGDDDNEEMVVFETKEELEPIVLKNISSGRFTGLLLSLLGGLGTVAGLTYLATEKLGIDVNLKHLPKSDTIEKILSWFSTLVGQDANIYIGAAVLGGISLLVMASIYALRVGLKRNKNLHFATEQYAQAEHYTKQKSNCKEQMDRVDAHIKDAIHTLKTYEVLLNEQKGKLERILHIEGMKGKSSDYHEKSFLEIRNTKELLRVIKDFISTSMSQEGKLSEQSVQLLQRAKTQMDRMLERLY